MYCLINSATSFWIMFFSYFNVSSLTLHPSHLHLDDTGSIVSEGGEVMPFTITPSSGQLPPGGEQSFFLRFSPLDVTTTECTFRCKCVHLCNAETTLSWSV